jgi:hypothetical protein
LKIGADPEVFVWSKKRKEFVCPNPFSTGTKEKPQPLGSSLWRGVQIDGMALEFNTTPVSICGDLKREVGTCLDHLKRLVGPDHEVVITPTADFSDEVWDETPEDNKILGCNADFNAWTGEMNTPPNPNVKFRSGAGHIHVSWIDTPVEITDDLTYVTQCVTKEMDASIGLASVLFDNDTRRRDLYGKAGAFRPKGYGVEYRTVSNAWLRSSVLTNYVSGLLLGLSWRVSRKEYYPEVEGIINNNDVEGAKRLLKWRGLTLPPKSEMRY